MFSLLDRKKAIRKIPPIPIIGLSAGLSRALSWTGWSWKGDDRELASHVVGRRVGRRKHLVSWSGSAGSQRAGGPRFELRRGTGARAGRRPRRGCGSRSAGFRSPGHARLNHCRQRSDILNSPRRNRQRGRLFGLRHSAFDSEAEPQAQARRDFDIRHSLVVRISSLAIQPGHGTHRYMNCGSGWSHVGDRATLIRLTCGGPAGDSA